METNKCRTAAMPGRRATPSLRLLPIRRPPSHTTSSARAKARRRRLLYRRTEHVTCLTMDQCRPSQLELQFHFLHQRVGSKDVKSPRGAQTLSISLVSCGVVRFQLNCPLKTATGGRRIPIMGRLHPFSQLPKPIQVSSELPCASLLGRCSMPTLISTGGSGKLNITASISSG